MQTSLRNATAADADRVADIYLTSRKTFLPYAPLVHTDAEIRLWVTEHVLPTAGVTVAVCGDDIRGFLATSADASYSWIDHLYLDSTAVGGGLGTMLLEHAKNTLKSPIRLYTFQENHAARRFYQRHGFREIELSDGATNEEKVPDVLLQWP